MEIYPIFSNLDIALMKMMVRFVGVSCTGLKGHHLDVYFTDDFEFLGSLVELSYLYP